MKRTLRITILMFALVGTFIAAAVPQVPALDGGPIPLCPPQQQHQQKCGIYPPMMK